MSDLKCTRNPAGCKRTVTHEAGDPRSVGILLCSKHATAHDRACKSIADRTARTMTELGPAKPLTAERRKIWDEVLKTNTGAVQFIDEEMWDG